MERIDVEKALQLPNLVKTGNFKFRKKQERGNISIYVSRSKMCDQKKKLTTKKTNVEKFILKKKIEKKGLVLKSNRKTTMGEEARNYLKRIEEKDQDEFRTLLLNKTKLRGVQQMRTEPGLCKQHQGESNCTC